MILLIGNYPPDQQQSMERFSEMMLQGLAAAGVDTKLIVPDSIMGNFGWAGQFARKWLGYIDKFLWFPLRLKKILLRGATLVHICDHSNAMYVRHCRSVPVLVTCHDLIAVRSALGENTDCPVSASGRVLQRWILSSLRRANVVACVSQATAKDAKNLLAKENDSARIEVVPLGLNYPYCRLAPEVAAARLARINVDSEYILHVGSNLPRKNRPGVLRIFARCRETWNGRLILAGDVLNDDLLDLANGLGISDRIIQVKNPSSETLEALYNCALAFLYPSSFEGFGWPIIEAQACGCPVICANSPPLPEVGGEAALYRRIDDEAGFAADVIRLTDPRERVRWSEKSLDNAKRFSTEQMIAHYIDIYRSLRASL